MHIHELYVTGFMKTDWIVTLGLFYFIGPANGYMSTLVHYTYAVPLPGLVDWSAFLRASFVNPLNLWLRQRDPWRVLHGMHGSEIHLSYREMSIQACLGLWLALLAPRASPNSPNGEFNLPPASHPPPPPASPPSCTPTPYNVLSVILHWFWKVAENPVV